ncbi:MAG: BspA family leucine-rich repeat surface protein [Ruminococcus sp.]|nr:BspA family leucine-rich repeat surface protein [Ruminococcus sp.]
MKFKKVIAAALSLFMLGGVVSYNAPAFRDFAIVADAAGECYTFNSTTGLLTLKGNVVHDEMTGFEQKDAVKSIKAAEGTVLPGDCTELFSGYGYCEKIDLSNADASGLTNMNGMFSGCWALPSVDLSGFDTRNVTDMAYMFSGCSSLTSLDVSSFDTSNVTKMDAMFQKCSKLESLDLSSFDTSSVTNMNSMFNGCQMLKTIDMSSFDTRNVTDMGFMFYLCDSLSSIDLNGFDTRNVTDMGSMFNRCLSLTSLDLTGFDTSNVTNMTCMFASCQVLTAPDLSNFDTSQVKEMRGMFGFCYKITTLDLSSFDTSSVTDMKGMFWFCSSLKTLNLSSFDTSNVESADEMFLNCTNLSLLTLGKDFGDISEGHKLPNGNGWVNVNDPSTVISGEGDYAAINNVGENTYIQYGQIVITEQPPEVVYFEPYEPAHITLKALGDDLIYSWYFKTTDRTTFLLDEEFEANEWTGSYDFYGLTGGSGLTDKYDGTEMYCKVWNKQGAELESEHFTLKKYQGDVDRNITIRLPKVGETYADYIADVNSIVPAELIVGDENFGIVPKNSNGNYIHGVRSMNDDDVFKAGYRYEFCFNMYLPEYVSTMAIYQFYSKGLIVNGEEHGGADSVYDEERYFVDFWTTPVLEGGLLEGDVNADGSFNISDVVLMQKWLLAVPDTALIDWKAGDLCEDGRLDAFDLSLMRNKLINT